MIHTFILGYSGAQYFSEWHPQVKFGEDIKFYYIDNGQQNLTPYLNKMLTHQSSKNLFCSGGWNLICDIAFDSFNLDKIIIGQEDAIFTDEILREIDNQTNSTQICGTYDRSFEFSLFGIHKDIFKNIGRFDENFILGGNEDNDYKQRCKLKNTTILSLNIPADFNLSLTGNERSKYNNINSLYLHEKWGNHSNEIHKIYEYEQPFNNKKINHITEEYKNYFDIKEENSNFMSELEYKLYKNKNKQV
jgi:hypothetical protein